MEDIGILRNKPLADYVSQATGQSPFKAGTKTLRFKKCPICDGGDHFNINTSTNYWNTFGNCGGGTIIDFHMAYYKVDTGQAIKELCNFYGIDNTIKKETFKQSNLTDTYDKWFKLCHDWHYFFKRLTKEFEYDLDIDKLIKKYKLMVCDPRQVFPKDILPNVPNIQNYGILIPIYRKGELVNCLLRQNEQGTNDLKILNLKGLEVEFFGVDKIMQNLPFIFVTEGIFDCLSIEILGYNSMCLNSVNMSQKWLSYIKGHISQLKCTTFILCMDNDEPGKMATDVLSKGLDEMGIKYKIMNPAPYNDINELFLNDLDKLKSQLEELTSIGIENNANHFMEHDFYNYVEKYINYQKKETGFEKLDAAFDGLQPSLYVVGAVSSIGKTTFMLQVADNIAQAGNTVLYFTLEQSTFELISKSMSRLAWLQYNEEVKVKDIMYNTDPEMTQNLVDLYQNKVGKNIFFFEGNFDTGLEEIIWEIEKFKEIGKNSLVVIIDYLQVIKGIGNNEKNVIDNLVTNLKKYSRLYQIPILVISSLNRANYLNPISYESFKESGSIEYTSDVLIGLQYQAVNIASCLDSKKIGEKRAIMKTAIDGDKDDGFRRDVELVILKNRHGKQQFSIPFHFWPSRNYFQESDNDIDLLF